MEKVKFWKKHDDDFSFDSSSDYGNDPFSTSTDPSMSGLPPDPLAGGSSDPFSDSSANSFADPLTPSPGGAFDDSSFNSPSTTSADDVFGPSSSSSPSQSFGSSNNSYSSFENPKPRDPFARPSEPPKPSVGKSLAQDYINKQNNINAFNQPPTLQPDSIKPGSENEILNLKLDAIRSELNSVAQRLIRLEHLIEEQNKKRGW